MSSSDFNNILSSLGMSDYSDKKLGRITVSEAARRTADGIVFDSMIEKDAYLIFKEEIGLRNFVIQPKFLLQPGFIDSSGVKHRPIYYIADFAFFTKKKDFNKTVPSKAVIVDIKGMEDQVFKIKHKMFLYKYNTKLYLPKTRKQIKELVEILKNECNTING